MPEPAVQSAEQIDDVAPHQRLAPRDAQRPRAERHKLARHEGKLSHKTWRRPAAATDPATQAGKPRWLRDQRNSWHGVDFPYHSDLDIERYYKRYCETLLAVDESVGRVLDTLDASPSAKNTFVVFAADSGVARGSHGLIGKQNLYEHSMRVPLIIAGPGVPHLRSVNLRVEQKYTSALNGLSIAVGTASRLVSRGRLRVSSRHWPGPKQSARRPRPRTPPAVPRARSAGRAI